MPEQTSIGLLIATAAFIGFFHTLTGPDHYIPFVALGKVRAWTLGRTLGITLLCGLGHVLSSIALGLIGIGIGAAVGSLEWIEAARGELAGWLLLAFGMAYTVWGIRRAIRNQPHTHWHGHSDGTVHEHEHAHASDHAHVHQEPDLRATPWVLFIIFVLGPCEPLIPLLLYPAAAFGWMAASLVAIVFAITTLATMMAIVAACHWGLPARISSGLERYSHAAAGLAVTTCGALVKIGL